MPDESTLLDPDSRNFKVLALYPLVPPWVRIAILIQGGPRCEMPLQYPG